MNNLFINSTRLFLRVCKQIVPCATLQVRDRLIHTFNTTFFLSYLAILTADFAQPKRLTLSTYRVHSTLGTHSLSGEKETQMLVWHLICIIYNTLQMVLHCKTILQSWSMFHRGIVLLGHLQILLNYSCLGSCLGHDFLILSLSKAPLEPYNFRSRNKN